MILLTLSAVQTASFKLLGDQAKAGDTLAQIWDPHKTGAAPFTLRAQRDGILAARHHPGLIKHGDCLAVLAVAGET